MSSLTHLTIITLLLLGSVSAAPRGCKATNGNAVASGKALYFITNDRNNAVVSLAIGPDGMLSPGSAVSTGGAGSNSIDGSTKQPATPDALVSQSALTISGNVC